MADAGDSYYRAFSGLGDNLAEAIQKVHKEREANRETQGKFDAIARLGVTPDNKVIPMELDEKGQPVDKNITPLVPKKTIDQIRQTASTNETAANAQMDLITRLGVQYALHAGNAAIEDASVSGQRAKQVMDQSAQAFPLEQAARAQRLVSEKQKAESMIDVPGIGPMNPSQYSAHLYREDKRAALEAKTTPGISFQQNLQNKYALDIPSVIQAMNQTTPVIDPKGNPVKDSSGKTQTFTGVPFVTQSGGRVSIKDGQFYDNQNNLISNDPKKPTIFAEVGKSYVPVNEWHNIANLSSQYANKAQIILSAMKQKDPSQLKPEEQKAIEWAQSILGPQAPQ